ncbi:DinB family protein [Erythrobacter sp. W53]|uniref:DinB family protein n=1 Tax=Erythrobacter sp. W53 TaxID=3425947 RepID=UPI003D7670F8
MISNTYLRSMARYNRWQNQCAYKSAASLSDEARGQDRGAFFKSIHGTLSHIYWADRIWLSRFDLCPAPDVPNQDSWRFIKNFEELAEKRTELDELLIKFCDNYESGPIRGELKWYSGAKGSDAEAPLSVIFTHFFNHQTHHRGQVHAMLTAAGAVTEDTDLFLMPAELWPSKQ